MESNNQNFSSGLIPPDASKSQPMDPVSSEVSSEVSDRSGSQSFEPKVRRQYEIFDAYHQIGSELKQSLKAFESNNLYLSNILRKLQQEIKILQRKKELQTATLVELQVKVKKLDQTKQSSVEECFRDKIEKLEMLNKEFDAVCEDDQYITGTLEKIKDLLKIDKSDVDEFYDKVQQVYASQVKLSDEYKENTESAFKTWYDKVKSVIEEEKCVDFELEEALQQCKNNAGLKEKYEYELQEKFHNSQQFEKEVGGLQDRVKSCMEELNDILVGNVAMNNDLSKTLETHSTELTEKRILVDGLKKEIEDKKLHLIEKESKLQEAVQESKYLSKQVENVESQIHATSREIRELDELIDEMTARVGNGKSKVKELEERVFEFGGVHQVEERISSRKKTILEKLASTNSIVVELGNKLRELQENWSAAKSEHDELKNAEEELKRRNEGAKKELSELLVGLGDVKETTKLKELELELSSLKKKSQILKERIDAAENRLKSATLEITELEEQNSFLDQELKDVSVREEHTSKKFEYFPNERVRLDALKTKISNVKEELTKIKCQVNVEHLKEEIKKVQKEIEHKKQQHETQKESIQGPFKITLRNVQEQMEKLKEASEKEMRRRVSQTSRFQTSIPQLQQEVQMCRDELVRTTEKNIVMMRERLKVTGRLVESYRVLQAQSQSANGKDFTVVRLLGTIEEHLASSFRGMIEYLGMTPVDLSTPSYSIYKRTLDNFERRFNSMTSEGNRRLTDPTYLAELKLAAFCLFGLHRYSEVAASDSTFFSPTSSSMID